MHDKNRKGIRDLLMLNPENLRQDERVNEQVQLNESLAVAYNLKSVLEPALEVVRLASGQSHRAVFQVSISQR